MTRTIKVLASVYAWWALVVLPGVLTLFGVFGDSRLEGGNDLGTAVVVVWIVGYLASFAMLYVVQAVVGHTRIWWWLVGSMLPWIVDWGAPYGWGIGLLLIGQAGVVAFLMAWTSLRSVRLEDQGRPVTATVVKVLPNRMNMVVNNVYIRRRVLLDIPAADGSTYQGVLPMLCEIGTQPSPGDTFRLRVDPANPKHFALDPTYRDA